MTPWRLTLRRFRRDRWSVVAAALLGAILLCVLAGGAAVSAAVGHNGTDLFPFATSDTQKPVGPWSRIPATHDVELDQYGDLVRPKHVKTTLLVLGADGPLGRDELIRLLDGGRTSLEIGVLAALIAAAIGVLLGSAAGYFGGWIDILVARLTETLMAFPLLLFLIFASVRLRPELMAIAYGSALPQGVVGVAVLIGVFTSFYPTRLVRSQLLTLRNAEFIEAEHMVGASDWRILRKHLFPHLIPTLLIWGAIAVATNILLEVGLSFIGVGVQPETATWGSMLSTTWGTIYNPTTYNSHAVTVWLTVFPTVAILLTVAALNQLSEGARRALEPWAAR